MPDTVIHRVEQLSTRNQQPEYLDLIFGLGLEFKDLPPNPDNEVNNDTRDPTFKGISERDTEQQMEYATNNDNPRETEEAYYIDEDNNHFDSKDRIVPGTESMGGVPREELSIDREVLVEDVPLEEME